MTKEGFVRCFTDQTVLSMAATLFHGRTDLVLVVIDEARVDSEIRYEEEESLVACPHIYGPLNLDAVVAVHDFAPDDDGRFYLPASLEDATLAKTSSLTGVLFFCLLGVIILAIPIFMLAMPSIRAAQQERAAVDLLNHLKRGEYEEIVVDADPNVIDDGSFERRIHFLSDMVEHLGKPVAWRLQRRSPYGESGQAMEYTFLVIHERGTAITRIVVDKSANVEFVGYRSK